MPETPLFLSTEEVTAALTGGLAALGAVSGAVGGGIGGGAAGALGGASGGSAGARFGSRFTKQDSRRRQWSHSPSPAHEHRLRQFLRDPQERALTAPDGSAVLGWYAIVGSGSMQLNPCLIEAVWDGSGLQVMAHAMEGLIKQRTCEKALDRLEQEVFAAG